MEETPHQTSTYALFYNSGAFKFPCCGSEVVGIGLPQIENPGEEETQIWCPYCHEFLFLEEFKPYNPELS